ncbi:thioredoxin-like protein [Phascolomyces articulosus]|uniref:Thioredoxin-like protein n=1 Tax=Phascolomyces articulosus TaxID=60185 RepID=A0AAD5KQL7_9FUNG|nr:thioredoxin-like protein [Phascolomyces articulosus]
MRERRIKEIQQEFERREAMKDNSHGVFTEITNEKEFMNITTSSKYVVGHFFHDDFRRCKIMDTHLETLAKKHYQTRFVKINVSNCPFLVEKLAIRVLPCVMAWVDGYAQTKIVGFDDLGGTDGFSTALLELKLTNCGVLKKKVENTPQVKGSIFQSNNNESDDDYD